MGEGHLHRWLLKTVISIEKRCKCMVDDGGIYEIDLVTEKIESENPLVIEAFPGIGLIGSIAGGHIIKELGMKYAGTTTSRLFAPIAMLSDGLVHPPIKIYEAKEKELIVIYSDIPINPILSYDLAKVFVDFSVEVNASEIVSIAGILTPSEGERVFGAATTEELLERVKKYTEIFSVGTISGLSGSIMVECFIRQIPAIGLIGETHTHAPDPLAASRVIEVINNMYGLEIDVNPLLEEAARIEAEMEHLAKQMKLEEQLPAKEFPMYG